MARMNDYPRLGNQADGLFFVGLNGGNAQDRIPPALGLKPGAGRIVRELVIQLCKIETRSVNEQRLDLLALFEQNWSRQLDRSIDRQVRVGDDFHSLQGR